MCITRLQGEGISIAIEIVMGLPNRKGVFETVSHISGEDSDRSATSNVTSLNQSFG